MSAEAEKEWGGAWSSIKHSSADFHASNRELRWCLLPATAVALGYKCGEVGTGRWFEAKAQIFEAQTCCLAAAKEDNGYLELNLASRNILIYIVLKPDLVINPV